MDCSAAGLFQELMKVFRPPVISDFQPDTLQDTLLLTLITGIVSVADWLGSMKTISLRE